MGRLIMLGLLLWGCAKKDPAPVEEEARGRRRGACSYVERADLGTILGRELKRTGDDGETCSMEADGLTLTIRVRHGDVSAVEQMTRDGGEAFPALGDQGVIAKGATASKLRAGWVRSGAGVDVEIDGASDARAAVKAIADKIAERL